MSLFVCKKKDHVVDSVMTLVTVRTSEGSVKWSVGEGVADKLSFCCLKGRDTVV